EPSLPKWFTPATAEDPQVRERFAEQLRAADDEGYAGCCEAIATMRIREHLGAIAAPTLVVAGAEDPATPPERSADLAAAVRGSKWWRRPRTWPTRNSPPRSTACCWSTSPHRTDRAETTYEKERRAREPNL